MEATDASRLVCVVVVSYQEYSLTHTPSLLIIQTQWSLASGPSSQSHTRTRRTAPRARPLPRPGGKEMRRWDSKGGAQTRMGGFSCAPRCPAFLTFRDSPALLRQESDGYPVRPVAATPTPTSHSPLLDPSSNSSAPTSRPTLGLRPARPCPSPPRAHTLARHAHTRQTRRPALKRNEKMGRRRPAGETPRLCNTPGRGCHRRSCA